MLSYDLYINEKGLLDEKGILPEISHGILIIKKRTKVKFIYLLIVNLRNEASSTIELFRLIFLNSKRFYS